MSLTERDRQKWDKLAAAESVTLSKIQKGSVTSSELIQLSRLLSGYSSVAQSLLRTTIINIEDKAVDRVANIQAKRTARGKSALDDDAALRLARMAASQSWQEIGPEMLVELEQIVNSSTDTLGSYMDDHFEQSSAQQNEWSLQSIDRDTQTHERLNEIWDSLSAPKPDSEAGKSLIEKAAALVGMSPNKVKEELAETAASLPGLGDDIDPPTKTNPLPVFDVGRDRRDRDNQNDEDEEGFIKSFWRRLKSVHGFSKRWGIMQELATLSALMLSFMPELRGYLTDKLSSIGDFFNQEDVKKVLSAVYGYLEDKVTSLFKWLMFTLGLDEKGRLEKEVEDYTKAVEDTKLKIKEQEDILSGKKDASPVQKARAQYRIDKYKEAQKNAQSQLDAAKKELEEVKEKEKKEKGTSSPSSGTAGTVGGSPTVDIDADSTTVSSPTTSDPSMAPNTTSTMASEVEDVKNPIIRTTEERDPTKVDAGPLGSPQTGGVSGHTLDTYDYNPAINDRLLLANSVT